MANGLQEHIPTLKARGMVELVGAAAATFMQWYLIAAPEATSYALTFVDNDGNQLNMADTSYVVTCQCEGTVAYVDESTKAVGGCTILSVDFAGSATNFLNSLNITVVGRRDTQPLTAA